MIAYNQGYTAGYNGSGSNPYTEEPNYSDWNRGYYDGLEAYWNDYHSK